MTPESKNYLDNDGNVYRVEQASNGRHVTMRINAGGNRKMFKETFPAASRREAQKQLDAVAKNKGWKDARI